MQEAATAATSGCCRRWQPTKSSIPLLFLLLLVLMMPTNCAKSGTKWNKSNKLLTNASPKLDILLKGLPPVRVMAPSPVTTLLGWSQWSEWSRCTAHKCGQKGVQKQVRRCLDMYCSGAHTRHRVCDAEAKECPANITIQPFALECALHSTEQEPLLPALGLPKNCSQLSCLSASTPHRLLTFPTRLRDGQPCQLGQNPDQSAVCFAGQCLSVGCDRLVGSRTMVDQCGVCGGDGQSCASQLFRWRDSGHFSPCDKSCGPGSVRVSVSVCVNTNNQRVVPERMCADQARPRPKVRKCAQVVCPAKWLTGEWEDCSVTCGLGQQHRDVFCAENTDGDQRRVADQYCWHSQKPIDLRKCSPGACPSWAVGDWGQCLTECGRGIRVRPVECRGGEDGLQRMHDWHCLGAGLEKPAQEQPCWTGQTCQNVVADASSEERNFGYAIDDPIANGNGIVPPQAALLLDEQQVDERPRFMAGAWGPCSASCGPGIRSRPVECSARQAISGQPTKLPDFECQGQSRPNQFQACQLAPCPPRLSAAPQAIRSLAQPFPPTEGTPAPPKSGFHWTHGQWSLCSATCLGGRQRAPVLCVHTATGQHLEWAKCEQDGAGPRPQPLVRACNRHSCPPDWEIGPWSTCSHSCGGGLRTRRVRCVRVVSRTGAQQLILPDGQCAGQRPGDEEPCGMVDCAPEWSLGHWAQCSTSCGPGEQQRTLSCVRRDSLGKLEEREHEECAQASGGETPPSTRLCNLGPCQAEQNPLQQQPQPFAYAEPGTEPIKPPESLALLAPAKDQPLADESGDLGPRRLTLRVGGFANLYEGTSVKVKCPVRAGERRQLVWTKNGRPLRQNSRIKVSQNGALRIFQARQKDAGIYACQTVDGQQQGNVTLRFKPNHEGNGGGEVETESGGNGEKQAAKQLLQRVRDSLFRLGEHALYKQLATVRDPSQIRVDFALSQWGECEHSDCAAGEGVQVRLLKCQIHVGTESAYLEDGICDAFGVSRPTSAQPCTNPRCPRWQTGDWSDCAHSRCVRHATALQRREVRCTFGNGTETMPTECPRKARPKLKRECQNENCAAEWRPSVWGKCSKQCGDGGVQMRLLRCVWHGTRKPAGPNCATQERPAAIRACLSKQPLPECPVDDQEENEKENDWNGTGAAVKLPSSAALHLCEDQSRFCDILRLFQSCDQARIKAQCCYSCRQLLLGQNSAKMAKGLRTAANWN